MLFVVITSVFSCCALYSIGHSNINYSITMAILQTSFCSIEIAGELRFSGLYFICFYNFWTLLDVHTPILEIRQL